MARKYNTRLIHTRRTYTTKEIAALFGMHMGSVQRWITKGGLIPVEGSSNPYLIYGHDLAVFLNKQKQSLKCVLQPDQFYCLKCRGARKSVLRDLRETRTDICIGNKGKRKGIRTGTCEACGTKMYRFFTYAQEATE